MTTSTDSAIAADDIISQRVRDLADLQAEIAKLTAEAENIKAELRTLTPGDYAIGGRTALRITPTRRFDATAAAGLLSVEQRKEALVVSYDAAKVKQHLTPVEVEEFMVESGKPKVQVL